MNSSKGGLHAIGLSQSSGFRHMKSLVKIGVVLAGYVAAVLLAGAALEVRLLNTQGPEAECVGRKLCVRRRVSLPRRPRLRGHLPDRPGTLLPAA